jgi:hypothetical protein
MKNDILGTTCKKVTCTCLEEMKKNTRKLNKESQFQTEIKMLKVQNSKQEFRSLSHRFTEAVGGRTYGLTDYAAYISL